MRRWGRGVSETYPGASLLAILIQGLLCKGAPGDFDGLRSLEAGPFKKNPVLSLDGKLRGAGSPSPL